MEKVYAELVQLGERAKLNNLAINMLIWSSWIYSAETIALNGQRMTQTLRLSGDPSMIMNNANIQGTVSNVSSDCPYTSNSVFYAKADASMVMQFRVGKIYGDPKCSKTVNPRLIGWVLYFTSVFHILTSK